MKESSLQNVAQLITQRFGLNLDSDRYYQAISGRVVSHKLASPAAYLGLLTDGTSESEQEWKALAENLTNGESQFFRDKGQIALLKERLLPELIVKNESTRHLRIWCAGCSTGEEPYTLAILLEELLPNRDKWNILIFGTDLNHQVIERARRGVYSQWSLRSVNPIVQSHYFQMNSAGWELDTQIRNMVEFRQGNLLQDSFPTNSSELHDMDLILCRNVFIYFDRHAVTRVLRKFEDTLTNGGYLMTGHGDLYDQNLIRLQVRTYDKSLIYQRTGDVQPILPPAMKHATSPVSLDFRLSSDIKAKGTGDRPLLAGVIVKGSTGVQLEEETQEAELTEVEALLQDGRYLDAINAICLVSNLAQCTFKALWCRSQAYANLGDHELAAEYCSKASQVDPLNPAPHQLMAMISEERSNFEDAKVYWKKVIYLDPESPPAYIELAGLFERGGDTGSATKMRRTGLALLKSMQPRALLGLYEGCTAGDLADHVSAILEADR